MDSTQLRKHERKAAAVQRIQKRLEEWTGFSPNARYSKLTCARNQTAAILEELSRDSSNDIRKDRS